MTAYVFSLHLEVEERFTAETSSGFLALGHTLAHLGSKAMPFGGVGESGIGKYHGRAGLCPDRPACGVPGGVGVERVGGMRAFGVDGA